MTSIKHLLVINKLLCTNNDDAIFFNNLIFQLNKSNFKKNCFSHSKVLQQLAGCVDNFKGNLTRTAAL